MRFVIENRTDVRYYNHDKKKDVNQNAFYVEVIILNKC